MTKRLILFFFLIVTTFSFGQKMKITGTVYDSTGTQVIQDVIAIAVRLKDSVLLDYSRTNAQGQFELKNVALDTFTLIISHYKFDDRSYFIFGSKENSEIDIPNIHLLVRPREIQEVVVYANKNPIYFRGDTLVYVADSFKVKENAVVEDLLKKLPGITVDEFGNIKSQGKEISKVFVDGDEFFGTDPTVATKNLGARGVETVEVYEKKNENAAEGEDEIIQVLNLKLKEEAKKGFFGRVSAASDVTQFYEGELLFNKFSNTQKFSVFLLTSNTPRSNLNWNDVDKFGLNNEASWKEDEDGNYYATGARNEGNGIPKTLRAGIYFSDKIGKKKLAKIGFNYSYNNYSLNAISQSYTQYFLADSTYYSTDSTRTITKNASHSLNFNFSTQLDSLTTIDFKPSVRFSEGSTSSADYSNYFTSEQMTSRTNTIAKGNESKGVNFDSETDLKRSFKKERRELKFRHAMKYGSNSSDGNLAFEDLYYLGTSVNDTTNQLKFNENANHTQSGKITYVEPLTKKTKLETEYFIEKSNNDQAKETRNILSNQQTEIDSTFTNNFENNRFQNRVGMTFIYESRKHIFSAGARYRNIQIENNNLFTGTSVKQNVTNFLPKASYTFKPSLTARINVKYSTSSNQPSVNMLQPVPDNSNPNKIVVGNADLEPTFSHSGNISLNTWNSLKNRYVWIGTNASYTSKGFADSINIDQDGRQYTKTVNNTGNIWASFYGGGSIALYKTILELSPGFNMYYSKNYSFLNGEKNDRTNMNYNGNLNLSLNLDSLSISVRAELGYVDPKISLNPEANLPYTNQKYVGNFSWNLPWWHLTLNTDISYTINGMRSDGYNISFLIWNASLEKAFLKSENLILSVHGNDMLNQNINAQRNVNTSMITDYKTKIISRYYLIKLTYKFNNKPPKTEEDETDPK